MTMPLAKAGNDIMGRLLTGQILHCNGNLGHDGFGLNQFFRNYMN